MYHSVSEKHLQDHVNEYAFRYNPRDDAEAMFGAVSERAKRVRSRKHGEYSPVGGQVGGERTMMGSVDYDYGLFVRPLYSYAEADRLAGVSRGTSNRWVKGYKYWNPYGERIAQPSMTVGPGEKPEEGVSFFDLISIKAIDGLRKMDFSTRAIRRVVRYCQSELQMDYPLATQTFKTDRHRIYVEGGDGHLLEVLGGQQGAQAWDAVLEPFLETLDYQNDLARRWWPLGRDELIVVDPAYGFGAPVIVDSGLRTELVAERAEVGDSPEIIAYDFNLTPAQVESAMLFENQLAA